MACAVNAQSSWAVSLGPDLVQLSTPLPVAVGPSPLAITRVTPSVYLTVPAAADTLETWGFAMPIEDDNLSSEDTVRKSSDLAELQGGLAYQEVLNQIKRSRCRPLYMCLTGFWC